MNGRHPTKPTEGHTTMKTMNMKLKTLCASALILATVCQLAPPVRANDGDWTPTHDPQWWWIYVLPAEEHGGMYIPGKKWWKNPIITDAHTIPGSFDTGNVVTFSLQNVTRRDYLGGDTLVVVHTIRNARGSIEFSEVMAKALLPAVRPGQAIRLRGTARTPSRLRGMTHFMELKLQSRQVQGEKF
jgi:hypothetical protein